jgi:ABC-type oligopeptide transport system substrate-binding subunit
MAALRMKLLSEAERVLVHDDFPIIPVYYYTISGLVKPKVKGFYHELVGSDGTKRFNTRDIHPLRDLWIDESGESR